MQTIIYILPELFLSITIMFLLMLGVFIKKSFKLVYLLTILSLIFTIALVLNQPNEIIKIFNESYIIDKLSIFMKVLTLLFCIFVLLLSKDYIKNNSIDKIEYPIIIIASIIFHFWSPWWWTPVASNWGNIDDTIILSFWVTGAVFVGVCLFMAYCVWRYRYRPDRRAEYEPENKKLEWRLTWLTSLGVAALLAPGLLVWNQFVTVPKNAFNVEVVAYQWGWNYRLPGEDRILGKTDAKLVSYENPYGLNLNDPNGKDDIIVQDADLHLQIDQPVKINLRSLDVIHNFYVPQFRAKMDTLPGIVSYYWFTPTKTGKYEILCAEFCGTGHYAMRGTVLVDEKKDYNDWLAQQITFEQILAQENMINEPKKLVKKVNEY